MLNINKVIARWLQIYAKKTAIAFMAVTVTALAWSNLVWGLDTNANATPLSTTYIAATAEGVTDKVTGKIDQAVGKAQRNLGEETGQVEGALKEVKGKAKEGIGTAKNKLDNAGDEVEDTSGNIIDSVKDFFD